MTDCLYKEGSTSGDEVNNDNLNSMTGFVGFESSDDKYGQDDGLLEHVSSNISSLSKNLQLMYEEMKFWSSKFVVKEGDVMIDISLAAKGMSSSITVGAQQQTLPYPGTFYRFDPCLFYGQNTELDIWWRFGFMR
jgi:hypothetical protein